MKSKIAVIGGGYWGKNLIRNFDELDALYAVCDLDTHIIKKFQAKYPHVKVFFKIDELLRDDGIDGVVVATPAKTHFEMAKQVISAGKDIFIEKPLSLHYHDAQELVSEAKKKKVVLMVGHILEYHPAVVKLKELIDKGKLGRINYIYSHRLNLGKIRTEENILWSFAPHDISIILNLLGEMPKSVCVHGGSYLNPDIADVTVTNMDFANGIKAHIFVSWLHPYKEQKLVVVGDKAMVAFNDVSKEKKLLLYNHNIDWVKGLPIPRKEEAEAIPIKEGEPLKIECQHFLDCIVHRSIPKTNGEDGLRVLKILEMCQSSLKESKKIFISRKGIENNYFIHPTSIIDKNVEIGEGTKIWHFSHILENSKIGKDCTLGQNVVLGPHVTIGSNVKIQNNVSVYEGVTLEDDVFCGPSMVFTNVINPRSHWPRKNEFKKTLVMKGVSLGANSTVVCGHTIGKYAFIGAGALVNRNIPDYALVFGAPARIQGWMCYCGEKLAFSASQDSHEEAACSSCGRKYKKEGIKVYQIQDDSD